MADLSFHPFTRLPVELQYRIWESAAQVPLGGTQYFALSEQSSDSAQDGDLAEQRKYTLGPPTCQLSQSSVPCWITGNPSAYLWNHGLWNACWGSREAMHRFYFGTTRVATADSVITTPISCLDVPGDRYIALRASSDLVVIQLPTSDSAHSRSEKNILSTTALFRDHAPANIAIEWAEDCDEKRLEMVRELAGVETKVWLFQPGMTAALWENLDVDTRLVFQSGEGRMLEILDDEYPTLADTTPALFNLWKLVRQIRDIAPSFFPDIGILAVE